MKRLNQLMFQRDKIKKGIISNLDLLMGSIVKAPSQSGYYLTDKVDGKTVTKYIRKNVLKEAGEMTVKHRRLRKLARELSQVNFKILRYKAVH
ncbi:DUF6788 family protein [Verrucomicrobiota bacterium]